MKKVLKNEGIKICRETLEMHFQVGDVQCSALLLMTCFFRVVKGKWNSCCFTEAVPLHCHALPSASLYAPKQSMVNMHKFKNICATIVLPAATWHVFPLMPT